MIYQFEVSNFTYIYAILAISSALCTPLAIARRRDDHIAAFILAAGLCVIGYLCNTHLEILSF